jgi:hypothetical protein
MFRKDTSNLVVGIHVSDYRKTGVLGRTVTHVSKTTIKEMFSLISRDKPSHPFSINTNKLLGIF